MTYRAEGGFALGAYEAADDVGKAKLVATAHAHTEVNNQINKDNEGKDQFTGFFKDLGAGASELFKGVGSGLSSITGSLTLPLIIGGGVVLLVLIKK